MIREYIENFRFSWLNVFLFSPSFSTPHFSNTKSSIDPQWGVWLYTYLFSLSLLFSTFPISDPMSCLYVNYLTDIDECTSKKHNCHVQSMCNNTIGGFMCTCNDGYWGDGITCKGTLVKCTRVLRQFLLYSCLSEPEGLGNPPVAFETRGEFSGIFEMEIFRWFSS